MRTRYRVVEQATPHFITSTVVEWIPVFTSSIYFDVVIQSLKFCREQKGLKLYGFVVMDSHIHLVAFAENLPQIMKEFKSYTATRLIKTLENNGNKRVLNDMAFFKGRDKTSSQHQFWQEGYHPQAVTTEEMLLQKLEYIHHNPVRRGLVERPEHWRYSSAANYFDGNPVMEIDGIMG